MLMNNDEMEQFPHLHTYIQMELPLLKDRRSNIWRAFKSRCENDILAQSAILYGQGPHVEVKRIMGSIDFDDNERILVAGRFPHDRKDRIYLASDIADTYERFFTHELQALVEGTLLHEAIHWARYHAKLSTGGGTEYHEMLIGGKRFEREAYGRDFGAEWRMILRRASHYHRQ